MNKFYTGMAAILLLGVAMSEASAASVTCAMQASSTTVTWKNELGSTAKIKVDSSGNVTGTYKDGSGSGATGPLVGFCNQNGIAFTVGWTGLSTITSWTGTYDSSTKKITTLWYLVNGASSAWNNTNAGTDRFKQKE
ncbi:MAG: autotransporter [Methylobacter sp.]|nr:autotransporter [Methylobacter sp.]